MLAVRQLRESLGMNRPQFADALYSSIRSVINWETGNARPDAARRRLMRNLMRTHGLTKSTRGTIPIRYYDPIKMTRYLGKPSDAGLDWRHMTLRERNSWWAQRGRYRKLQAKIDAGLVLAVPIAQPIVKLLDSAPDLELT